MFIQTEETPNPATLKFLPGRDVMGAAPPADFPNAESAKASPLAESLFKIPQVSSVFLGSDFITITKSEDDWQQLKPILLTALMDFFLTGLPVINQTPAPQDVSEGADGEEREKEREDRLEERQQVCLLVAHDSAKGSKSRGTAGCGRC